MLSLTDAEVSRIRAFISKRLANPRNELEARLCPNIRGQNEKIDHYRFRRILTQYTYSVENGGFGLKKELVTQLTVRSDRTPELRECIQGSDAVRMLWLTGDIDLVYKRAPEQVFQIIKRKVETCDISNYALRISLSDEHPVSQNKEKTKFQFFANSNFPKHFRMQNRISVFTKDGFFRIDFTSIKTGVGRTFRQSNTISSFPTHEIEIEFVGSPTSDKQVVFDSFIQHIGTLLSIYHESPILITNSVRQDVLDQYNFLVSKNERLRKSNNQRNDNKNAGIFIAANPVTLHRENMVSDPRTPNILRNYGVTYKADGIRNLLFVAPGKDDNDPTKEQLYLLDNNFRVLPVGLVAPGWGKTIIEGEYIADSRTLYSYDMLYAKGLDIRNKPLESFSGQPKSSRLGYLREFLQSLSQPKLHLQKAGTKENIKEIESIDNKKVKNVDDSSSDSESGVEEEEEEESSSEDSSSESDSDTESESEEEPEQIATPQKQTGGTKKDENEEDEEEEEEKNTDLLKDNKIIHISAKPYLFGNGKDIFVKARQLWTTRESQPYHVDGLIFAPGTEAYPAKPISWNRLFKWKPPHLNTIDFLIQTVKSENKRDKLFPYIQSGVDERVKATSPYTVKQYKILKLYVSGMIETYTRRDNRLQRRRGPVLFREIKVPVDDKERIIARDPFTGTSSEVIDDTIVEFAYRPDSDFPWTPLRIRYDKTEPYKMDRSTFGNAEHVARDVWRSIEVPVTEEMIVTGNIPASSEKKMLYTRNQEDSSVARLPYQIFHTRYVKKLLLEEVALKPPDAGKGSGALLDFGCSRGGDLHRWREIGFRRVVGLDIDADCIQQSNLRYEGMKIDRENFQVNFVCADLTRTIFPNYNAACDTSESKDRAQPIIWRDELRINIPRKYTFDVISSQFVIHYVFKNELSLRSYMQNVTDNLAIGGHFVGTTFDGEKVYNFLKRKTSAEGQKNKDVIWKINKNYGSKKFVDGKPNFGMSINVYVKTIGVSHEEYLVSLKYLATLAEEYGLDLVRVTPFADLWKQAVENSDVSGAIRAMSESEKQFSFLNSAFIFKKVRHAPDILFKKLVKLQKSKSSK